ISAAGGETLTIRAEGDPVPHRRTSGETMNSAVAALEVPEPHGPIQAGRGQHPTIWTEGHATDDSGVAGEDQGLLVHPPLQEVPFPAAQLGPALVEELFGAGRMVRRQLPFRQGDPLEVGGAPLAVEGLPLAAEGLALAVEGLLQTPVGPPDRHGT